MNFYEHFDSIGYIEECAGEFGTFRYMNPKEGCITHHLIKSAEEAQMIKNIEAEGVRIYPVLQLLQEEIQNGSFENKILNPFVPGIENFDYDGALAAVIQMGIDKRLYFVDIESSEFFDRNSSESFFAKIRSYAFWHNK